MNSNGKYSEVRGRATRECAKFFKVLPVVLAEGSITEFNDGVKINGTSLMVHDVEAGFCMKDDSAAADFLYNHFFSKQGWMKGVDGRTVAGNYEKRMAAYESVRRVRG